MKIIIKESLLDKIDAKWIYFLLKSKTEKTAIYSVLSKEGDFLLGEIKWFSRWRKYAFFPTKDTVYESKCLTDIAVFLDDLMQKRKKV